MNTIPSISRRALLGAVLAAASLPLAAGTGEVRHGDLVIRAARVTATVKGQKATGAFMEIENRGGEAEILLGADSPVAKMVQIHRTEFENGIARMRPAGRVTIPAGGRVVLARGGLHVMLMGLTRPLAPGETVPLTLRFARAGAVTLTVPVVAVRAAGAGGS